MLPFGGELLVCVVGGMGEGVDLPFQRWVNSI